MTYLEQLQAVAALPGIMSGDSTEQGYLGNVTSALAAVSASIDQFVANTGLLGLANDAAMAWATAVRKDMDAIQTGLTTWASYEAQARFAMRVAASQANSTADKMPKASITSGLAQQPEAISPITGAMVPGLQAAQDYMSQHTQKAEGAAKEILDTMNKAVEDAIPKAQPTAPQAGVGAGGIGYKSMGGFSPNFADFPGYPGYTGGDIQQPNLIGPDGKSPTNYPVDGGSSYPGYVSPDWDSSSWDSSSSMSDLTTTGSGSGAGWLAGLTGAAAVAAALAYGAGSSATLGAINPASFRPAPVGGVIGPSGWADPRFAAEAGEAGTPGQSGMTGQMPPGMAGGAGGGDQKRKRRPGGYQVVHLQDTDQATPDAGPGALPGSTETLGTAPQPESQDWW